MEKVLDEVNWKIIESIDGKMKDLIKKLVFISENNGYQNEQQYAEE